MKANVELRVVEARSAINNAKMQVDLAVCNLHRAEGAQQSSSIATKLEVEIVSIQDEEIHGQLLALMSQLQGNPVNNIAQLEQIVLEAKVSHLSVIRSLVCRPFNA